MKQKAIYTLFAVMLALLAPTVTVIPVDAGEKSAQVSVHIQEISTVTHENVLLGDIARITGNKELSEIVIGRAPFPGHDRIFRKGQIITRLKQHDVDLEKVRIVCPDIVTVLSDYNEYCSEKLARLARDYVFKNMPWQQEWVRIEDFFAKKVMLPKGNVNVRFSFHKDEDFLGRFNTEVFFYVDGHFKKKIRMTGNIIVKAPVTVCSRDIARNEVITAQDVRIQTKDITYESRDYILDTEALLGKKSRINISAGTVLHEDMFKTVPAVQRGDMVTLVVETDSFKITVPGMVLENACSGGQVWVKNLASNNKVCGLVRNSKVITVGF